MPKSNPEGCVYSLGDSEECLYSLGDSGEGLRASPKTAYRYWQKARLYAVKWSAEGVIAVRSSDVYLG